MQHRSTPAFANCAPVTFTTTESSHSSYRERAVTPKTCFARLMQKSSSISRKIPTTRDGAVFRARKNSSTSRCKRHLRSTVTLGGHCAHTKFWYNRLMAKNTSVLLGDHFADFVDSQVASGRFSSASEVVRAGLRLLEEHDAKLETLREALIEGEKSGPAAPFNRARFIKRMRGKRRPTRTNG